MGVRGLASREGWSVRKRAKGKGFEYALQSLPIATRQAIAAAEIAKAQSAAAIENKRDKDEITQRQSLATLSGWRKEETEPRAAIYVALRKFHKQAKCTWPQTIDAYNAGLIPVDCVIPDKLRHITLKTWENWRARVRKKGLAALAPAYGNRRGAGMIDTQPEIREVCVAMITAYPHVKAERVHELINARFSEKPAFRLPALSTVRDWITRWKADNASLYTAVTSPDKWRNQYMPAFGSASESVIELNQLWEMDASPADILCTDGRYKLLQLVRVFDRQKRYVVSPLTTAGHYASLLRTCLLTWGKPTVLRTDNGAAESGTHITRICEELEIELELTIKFHSWEKSFVERGFETLQHDLIELLPGYVGHNVAQREDLRSQKAYSDRLLDKDAAIDVKMSSSDLQAFIDKWCEARHHRRPQEDLDNRSPFEVAAAWPHPVEIVDERALDLLLAEAPSNGGWRSVTKSYGISVDGHEYIAYELSPGDRVHVLRDPVDLGRVLVRKLNEAGDLEFVCWASNPELTGIDRREVAIKTRAREVAEKQGKRRELKRDHKRLNIHNAPHEILEHDTKQAAKTVAFPQRTVDSTTPGLESTAAAVNARTQATTTLTPEQQAAHERLVAELKQPKAEVVELPEDGRARYRRWHALNERATRGDVLTEAETKFHARYPRTAEYQSQHLIFTDFPHLLEQGAQQ